MTCSLRLRSRTALCWRFSENPVSSDRSACSDRDQSITASFTTSPGARGRLKTGSDRPG